MIRWQVLLLSKIGKQIEKNGLIPNHNHSNKINAKSLEAENKRLKKLVGKKVLEIAILSDLFEKQTDNREQGGYIKKWIYLGYPAVTVLNIIDLPVTIIFKRELRQII